MVSRGTFTLRAQPVPEPDGFPASGRDLSQPFEVATLFRAGQAGQFTPHRWW